MIRRATIFSVMALTVAAQVGAQDVPVSFRFAQGGSQGCTAETVGCGSVDVWLLPPEIRRLGLGGADPLVSFHLEGRVGTFTHSSGRQFTYTWPAGGTGGGGDDGTVSGVTFDPSTNILTVDRTVGQDLTADLSALRTDQTARDAAAAAQSTANTNASAIAGETTNRVAGDMLTATTIATPEALTAALNAQATSGEALRIHFTADVVHSGTTYAQGQVSYVAPRSGAIENEFVLPESGAGSLSAVATSARLTGDGTSGSPLDIADQGVDNQRLGFESVGPRNLQANSVRSGHITDNSVQGIDIGNNQIVSRHVAANQILRGQMTANSVGSTELVDGDVAEVDLTAAVRTKLNAGGGRAFGTSSGEIATWAEGDSTARLPAAKVPVPVDQTARNAAAAAQLDADTVIEIWPPFHPDETAARNIYVSIRHPVNAYSAANILSVAVQGESPVLVSYTANTIHQDLIMEVPATAMRNIFGSSSRQRKVLGDYVNIEVRLRQGRNGPTEFFRTVDVPVVARPASVDPVILQAAVAGGDTAGVASITLPATFTRHDDLVVAVWDSGDDQVIYNRLPIAHLAVQTSGTIVLEGNPGTNNAIMATWVLSTRAFGISGNRGRILYAALR